MFQEGLFFSSLRDLLELWFQEDFGLILSGLPTTTSKSKSKKTVFNVGQCKQYNISSHFKWVLVADKSRCLLFSKCFDVYGLWIETLIYVVWVRHVVRLI